jgi:ADP-ribose pyrophosphatase YjhB (NUDIX family)
VSPGEGAAGKRAVSVLVEGPGGSRLLAVRRPEDDDELPGAWGLPAASLRGDEGWAEAAARIGPEKLGVDLDVGDVLREGEADRDGYRLGMRLYGASVAAGEPEVPQDATGVTQYVEWAWARPDRLRDSARRGSLCSRLCLEHVEAGNGPGG